MNKYDLVNIIEQFAPPEFQEKWDCSGWIVETNQTEINRVMIALTVDEKVFRQAINKNCDMIISHHPLFKVPLVFRGIDIYCAHTNMDKTLGGTTDTFVSRMIHAASSLSKRITLYVPTSGKFSPSRS